MNQFIVYLLLIITISANIKSSHQLECYVCQNQEDNKGKCSETVKICDLEEEQCLTEVRWGSKPYWSPVGQKQNFISKRCATKRECQEVDAHKTLICDRIWYNDWNCTTCCSGDKCNYYVTLAGNPTRFSNPPIMITSLLMTASVAIYSSFSKMELKL